MSRFVLLRKEVYELVLERRLLLTLLLVSGVFSLVVGVMANQPPHSPPSPLGFLQGVYLVGPIIVALLAIALAGDAIARERQDRTLHLLFTAPATLSQYGFALVGAHLLAFGAFALLLVVFSVLVGLLMGWVAVKGMAILLLVSLLPLFLIVDLLVLAGSARLGSGRASLLVAIVLVLVLWSTSLMGPFRLVYHSLAWWDLISAWHPFDLAGSSGRSLVDRGELSWAPILKSCLFALIAGALAWASLVTKEVGK